MLRFQGAALLITLAVELPLAAALAGREVRRRVLLVALLLNVFTHPLAVLAMQLVGSSDLPWVPLFFVIEAIVIAVEAIGYHLVAGLAWRRAALIAVVCNVTTAALSPLLSLATA